MVFWLISFWNSHLILNAKETFSHVPSNKCDTLHLSPQDSWKPKEVDPLGAQSSCSVYCNDMATIWTSCCRFLSTQFFSHQNVLLKRRKKQPASRVMSLPMDLCCVRNWPYKRTGRAFKTSNSSNRKCSWKRGTKWNLQCSLVSASVVSPWEMERQQKDPEDIHMQFPPSKSHVIIVANS
jgi:hypothetical protein